MVVEMHKERLQKTFEATLRFEEEEEEEEVFRRTGWYWSNRKKNFSTN